MRSKGGWIAVKRSAAAAGIVAAALLCGCDGQTVSHEYHSLPFQGWSKGDTLTYWVALPDSGAGYGLWLDVRNRNDYPYQELWLRVASDGLLAGHDDTLRLTLADKRGRWTGEGWGGLYQNRFFMGSVRPAQPDTFAFHVVSLMPDTLLTGVNDIGLRVERSH